MSGLTREGVDGASLARPCAEATEIVAASFRVRGVVQGVGFRPYVYGLAKAHALHGWVRNTSAGVEIVVEGAAANVEAFAAALPKQAPARAFIASCERFPATVTGAREFAILASSHEPLAYQLVSPDIALCDDCRRELLDPTDRRYRYPFINCTNCGPRFTIIESLPYDRERTTMRDFPMCEDCRSEYADPTNRRFHAEPIACPVCGPHVELWSRGHLVAERDAALEATAELLAQGAIVAVKGLGGFHLACDATDDVVVARLKRRKGRPHKPLAVMFRDLDQIRAHCRISDEEAALLSSPEHPIVLVGWPRGEAALADEFGLQGLSPAGPNDAVGQSAEPRAAGSTDGAWREGEPAAGSREGEPGAGSCEGEPVAVSRECAVRQRYLGVMLPYTPLHVLLLEDVARPLVMTSGNVAEEPIVTSWNELARLGDIPDYVLTHDRDIYARYDDSVALVRRAKPRLVRRSRGYAPFPITLPQPVPQVLACGAELKNTFCLTRDRHAFLSQHIGDLENLETLVHFEDSIELYKRLFRLAPEAVAYDLHPEYLATKYALALPDAETPRGKVGVQHHHAHVAACLAEHGHSGPVIGVALDGLGYGGDGRLWGGEVLVCDLTGFRRAAHFEYLPLPGGAAAIHRPARTAAGWLVALFGREGLAQAPWLRGDFPGRKAEAVGHETTERPFRAGWLSEAEIDVVARQVETGVNAPLTSSCGRLFDVVAALSGLRGTVTYEGQAAVELEMISAAGAEPLPYEITERPLGTGDQGGCLGQGVAGADNQTAPPVLVVGLRPVLTTLLKDGMCRREPALAGSRLHTTLATVILDLCRRLRAREGLTTVALSGGVFQNRLLTDLCEQALTEDGFVVLTHALVPTNDGGISLGQAVVAGSTLVKGW